jgi:acetyl-CoA C-acetyltransferase
VALPAGLDPRTPVLVGVGTAHRPRDGSAAVSPLDLMVEASLAAGEDCGVGSLLARAGTVAVPQGTWDMSDPGRVVAAAIGAAGARTILVEVGIPQHTPVGAAIAAIAGGSLDVALVVGGEAMASRRRAERDGAPLPGEQPPPEAAGEPDDRWRPTGDLMDPAEVQAGIWSPVEQYACMENALRHAEGRTLAQHLDEIAVLWAGFNAAAAGHPDADFAEPRSFEQLRTPGVDNRPLAFPYAKWHSTQWTVDQAAALLLCSAGAAADAGVPSDRWIFPHLALESSHLVSLTRRADLYRWPAMRVLGMRATTHLGRPLASIEHVECYSCFPVAVRVQQRELELPVDGVPTVTGGMAFAGGPFNNFTYQATAAVVGRLRGDPSALGMVTTVSGLLSKPGLAVWGARPSPGGVLVADHAADAAVATPTREVTASAEGEAIVATFTVAYQGTEPTRAFVIADLPDGRRWIGTSHDRDLIAAALRTELIGTRVRIDGAECHPA